MTGNGKWGLRVPSFSRRHYRLVNVFLTLALLPSTLFAVAAAPTPQAKNADRGRGRKAGKVLLFIDEPASVSGEDEAVSRRLAQKLSDMDVSVTSFSDLDSADAGRLRKAIQKLQQGDKKAGDSIPAAIVVIGKVSTSNLDPFNDLYMADANASLKAVDTRDGKTVAIENVADIRGFGNSRAQAARDALKKACEAISEKFVKQISSASR